MIPVWATPPRCAVVDLGSNSVRLVVYEGLGRNPVAIFNEKATLRLGRGLATSGRLNADAIGPALRVMARYAAIARAMQADPFEVLATAAVRDASNGPAFRAELEQSIPGLRFRILTGPEEAGLSADGVLCGIPDALGVMADIGGGSLEVVRLGGPRQAVSLGLGVIKLSDRAEGDPVRARAIADADLSVVPWLQDGAEQSLYLVGGAFRALARAHMLAVGYPLNIVHHYTIGRDAARDLADRVMEIRKGDRVAGTSRRRADDLPMAAIVLRRLLRQTGAARVVWSADGIREGWYMRQVPPSERTREPMLAAAQEIATRYGRDPNLPPALYAWTTALFDHEPARAAQLRLAACWLSDCGAHDHPEYRAEQAFLRVFHQPGVAIDHPGRAQLALTVALRYEAEPDASFLLPARALLDPDGVRRAEVLGTALRLAYVLSAGTTALLAGANLRLEGGRVGLQVTAGTGVFAGDGAQRRLYRLATAIGLVADPIVWGAPHLTP